MARAYAYCIEDAPFPEEINTALAIKDLGVDAVFGRSKMTVREIRDYVMADRAMQIIRLFHARASAESWPKWEEDYPQAAEALRQAHKVYKAWKP